MWAAGSRPPVALGLLAGTILAAFMAITCHADEPPSALTATGRATAAGGMPVTATVSLPARAEDGRPVTVAARMETDFPQSGKVTLTLTPSRAATFTVKLRVPAWCPKYAASVGGKSYAGAAGQFLDITRLWKPGDRIDVDMEMRVQVLKGGAGQPLGKRYPDKVAIQRGPQVLAVDDRVSGPALPAGWVGTQVYTLPVLRGGTGQARIRCHGLIEVGDGRVLVPDGQGGRFQAFFFGSGRQAALLRRRSGEPTDRAG